MIVIVHNGTSAILEASTFLSKRSFEQPSTQSNASQTMGHCTLKEEEIIDTRKDTIRLNELLTTKDWQLKVQVGWNISNLMENIAKLVTLDDTTSFGVTTICFDSRVLQLSSWFPPTLKVTWGMLGKHCVDCRSQKESFRRGHISSRSMLKVYGSGSHSHFHYASPTGMGLLYTIITPKLECGNMCLI